MNKIRKKWCDFVLNEGLMPTMAARFIKNNSADDENLYILVADILINKENADIDNFPQAVTAASFKADTQLFEWLDSIKELLDVIKAYADKGDLFTAIVDEACISFIKLCPLLADEIKQKYLESAQKASQSFSLKSDIRQNFRAYLTDRNYSANTINSYISGINVVGSLANIQCNLWDITDPNEMKHLVARLEANTDHLYDEYKERDLLSRKTFSNALKRYVEFLTSVQ